MSVCYLCVFGGVRPTVSEKQEITSGDDTDRPVEALASKAEVVTHLEDSFHS